MKWPGYDIEWRAALDRLVYFGWLGSRWTEEKALVEIDYLDAEPWEPNAIIDVLQLRLARRKLVLEAFRYGEQG
jgi:hypothetical protein